MVWSTYSSFSTLLINLGNIMNNSVKLQGIPRIDPGAVVWEAQTLPLCCPPLNYKSFWKKFQFDLHLSQLFDNVIVVCRGSAQGYVTMAIHVLGGWVHADVGSKLQRALRRNTFVCWQLSCMALWLRLDLMSVLKLTLIRLVQPMK